jgi:hypothetical protein
VGMTVAAMPTPAAPAAAPARSAVRRLMGAFVLADRSYDIVILLSVTRNATMRRWALPDAVRKASPP